MLGLGNTPGEPWLYTIGFVDRPVVGVTREIYNVWESCDLAGSLWSTVEAVAGLTSSGGSGAERGLTSLLGTIHHLLTMSVVYLEPCR
jgi:hypothetical protein